MTPIHAATPAQLAQHMRLKEARERLGHNGAAQTNTRERAMLEAARAELAAAHAKIGEQAEIIAGLKKARAPRQDSAVTLGRLAVEEVAARHGVPVPAVYHSIRTAEIVAARHEAIAAVRKINPHWSLSRLGQFFGGRDHTTILHALRKQGVA